MNGGKVEVGSDTDRTDRLDSLEEIERVDRSGMLAIVQRFDHQLHQSLETASGLAFPEIRGVSGAVLLGLGGSAIGGDLVRAWLGSDLGFPFAVVRGYTLPGWVGASTLCVASSYSGNTEETLAALEAARERGAPCVVLTSGGELERIARRDGLPIFPFPEGQPPRTALPYSFVAVLWALCGAGLIPDPLPAVRSSRDWVRGRLRLFGPDNPTVENPAKLLARKLGGRIPVVYGSHERLGLIARRWAAQFCENAKVVAYSSELPEMNHNEVAGWEHPQEALKRLVPILLRDHEDHPRIQIRLEITREILGARVDPVLECWSAGSTWLERLWSLVLLGDFASVYLAVLNREDPTPVEAIEALKLRLKQY